MHRRSRARSEAMRVVNCGLRIADCGFSYDPKSEIRNPKLHVGESLRDSHSRLGETRPRGVTLIELMIVMLIISILAALVLGVAAVAGETARQAQTRHVVERMHTLLLEYYDTYKTRRVKLKESDPNTQNGIEARVNKNITNPAVRGQALSEARLYALREMMLMEVPDRWSDVLLKDVGTAGLGADDAAAPQPASSAKFPTYLAN